MLKDKLYIHDSNTRKENALIPDNPIRVSDKLYISALPLEHNQSSLDTYKGVITKAIQDTDGIICEYFPPELRLLDTDVIGMIARHLTNYDSARPFFEYISEQARLAHKDGFALDPAHNLDFIPVRVAESIGLMGVSKTLVDVHGIVKKSKKELSRREFLRFAGILSLGAVASAPIISWAAESLLKAPSVIPNEANFRRVVVARGITQLGKMIDAHPDIDEQYFLLSYPPVHWQHIKSLLLDRELLEKDFALASNLKAVVNEDSLFSIRHYRPVNGIWSPIARYDIQ